MTHRYLPIHGQMWFAGFVSVISLSLYDRPDIKSVMYASV